MHGCMHEMMIVRMCCLLNELLCGFAPVLAIIIIQGLSWRQEEEEGWDMGVLMGVHEALQNPLFSVHPIMMGTGKDMLADFMAILTEEGNSM